MFCGDGAGIRGDSRAGSGAAAVWGSPFYARACVYVMADDVCPECYAHYPCAHANASMGQPSGAMCTCGHVNVQHGKSTLVSPGCDACDCAEFKAA